MFIAHLPAGYVTASLLHPRLCRQASRRKQFFFWAMLGAWVPDIDLVYFYLVDHRQHPHHQYFTHYPLFWLGLLLLSLVWFKARPVTGSMALVFCLGGFGHMLLDSIVGDICWLAPFYDKPFSLFVVPAYRHPWWLNFVLHWSFVLELALVGWALYLFRQSRNRPGTTMPTPHPPGAGS